MSERGEHFLKSLAGSRAAVVGHPVPVADMGRVMFLEDVFLDSETDIAFLNSFGMRAAFDGVDLFPPREAAFIRSMAPSRIRVLGTVDPPDGAWSRPPAFEDGAAGLVSTADDLYKFARMLLGGGAPVLAPESVAAMTVDQLTPEQKARGGLGFGLPAAVGIALGKPGEKVIAVIGDGSSMFAIQGLWTAGQLGLPMTVVIIRNGRYQALEDFGRHFGLTPPGTKLPALYFVALAAGHAEPLPAQHLMIGHDSMLSRGNAARERRGLRAGLTKRPGSRDGTSDRHRSSCAGGRPAPRRAACLG